MSTHQHLKLNNAEASWGKRLIVSMVMNLLIPVAQIYGGIVAGSMALLSDALHNLSDFFSLVINYAALIIGKRSPTFKHTFGYKRVEIFATLISVALLYGAGFYIAFEAWHRFREPQPIAGTLSHLDRSSRFCGQYYFRPDVAFRFQSKFKHAQRFPAYADRCFYIFGCFHSGSCVGIQALVLA